MNLKEFTANLLEFRRGIISRSFFNHNAQMKAELYTLLNFLDKFLKKSNLKEINKNVQALLVKLITIYSAWDQQDKGNESDFNRLSKKMLGTEEYSMATLKQDIDVIIRLCEIEESQELNYENFIVSTNEVIRFIHKTVIELTAGIMKNGLNYSGSLNSTATMCSRDLANAKQSFFKKHKSSDAAIILEFPLSIWTEIKQKLRDQGDYESHPSEDDIFSKSISVKDTNAGIAFDRVIKPEFIVGYIGLKDNSVHLNPYRNR